MAKRKRRKHNTPRSTRWSPGEINQLVLNPGRMQRVNGWVWVPGRERGTRIHYLATGEIEPDGPVSRPLPVNIG